MGIGGSSPVDEATKKEIEDTIKTVLKTFTTEYVKWTAIYMVKQAQEAAKKGPSPYVLLERPPSTEPLKMGYMMKEGAIVKSPKKRYFYVRPDFQVEYYASEDDLKKEKPKPKGTMSLCGYYVNDDPNKGTLQRLMALAEKMGMNMNDLPKPKQYPPFTIELHHWRRRTYYVMCENEEDFKKWVDMFRHVCWRAYGLKNRDWVHRHAFAEAIRRTRWQLGRWGWWSWGGSEEQVLSDLISDQIEWAVMGRVYSKINKGPWIVRHKVQSQVLKTLDTAVSAAVRPAWAAMEKAVEEVKPTIAPALEAIGTKMGEVEFEIRNKMKEAVLSIINPLLDEHVTPHLGKIFQVINQPMADAYNNCHEIWNEKIEALEMTGGPDDLKKRFKDLARVQGSWDMYKSTRVLDELYEPLWALNLVFPDIYPWWSIWKGQGHIRKIIDNGFYTFEEKTMTLATDNASAVEGAKATIREEVFTQIQHDSQLMTLNWYKKVLMKIVMPPLNALAVPAAKVALDPLNDLIPDPMKTFIDINGMFDDLLNDIVGGAIVHVLDGASQLKPQGTQAIQNS